MKITGAARLAGIMGWPVAHSRSPLLHGFWLKQGGIDGVYLPLRVQPGDIEQALRALPILGFRGCNLTIPHKQTALDVVDRVDPLARRIGAVNTIVVAEDGSLGASNTDIYGFRENLRECAPGWNPMAATAVVLGAGGSSRAVIAALVDSGVAEIRIVNRTLSRAESLAADLQTAATRIAVHPWDRISMVLEGAGLLVNTTESRNERRTATGSRSVAIAVIGAGGGYCLCPARNEVAGLSPSPRPSCGRWSRHVVASGPPRVRGMVRRQGSGQPRVTGNDRQHVDALRCSSSA